MSIAIINPEEKDLIKLLRAMPAKAKKALMLKIEEIREEMEEAKDIADIKKRANEESIPMDEAWKMLGI